MSDYEDVKVTDLVINNISQEKYDELKTAGQLEATQIYLTPTEESGGGSGLPDQTDNAGKFLTTDGTTASWSDKPLVNKAVSPGSSLGIVGTATGVFTTAVGIDSDAGNGGTAVGYSSQATSIRSVAVGQYAKAQVRYAIQLGYGTNSDANTFKVANENGNFELMSADGTIPAERMSSTTGTTGQVLTKTDTGMEWQDASGGAGGLTEVTVGTGLEGNGTSGNPLAIDTTFLDTTISANYTVSTAQQDATYARGEASQALTLAQANEQALASKQDTLTAEQLLAVNSGITADKVAAYDGYAAQIAGKQAAGDYVSASTEGTGGQLLSILLCSNEAEALELSGTHAGSLCFFPAVTE